MCVMFPNRLQIMPSSQQDLFPYNNICSQHIQSMIFLLETLHMYYTILSWSESCTCPKFKGTTLHGQITISDQTSLMCHQVHAVFLAMPCSCANLSGYFTSPQKDFWHNKPFWKNNRKINHLLNISRTSHQQAQQEHHVGPIRRARAGRAEHAGAMVLAAQGVSGLTLCLMITPESTGEPSYREVGWGAVDNTYHADAYHINTLCHGC